MKLNNGGGITLGIDVLNKGYILRSRPHTSWNNHSLTFEKASVTGQLFSFVKVRLKIPCRDGGMMMNFRRGGVGGEILKEGEPEGSKFVAM